jgi:hypothetical protein
VDGSCPNNSGRRGPDAGCWASTGYAASGCDAERGASAGVRRARSPAPDAPSSSLSATGATEDEERKHGLPTIEAGNNRLSSSLGAPAAAVRNTGSRCADLWRRLVVEVSAVRLELEPRGALLPPSPPSVSP